MRITKDPQERKDEILSTAMNLFYEKGFEKTSISDIAKELNVAQGLCYRYFSSKEILFEAAIDKYASLLIEKMVGSLDLNEISLKDLILKTSESIEEDDNPYYKVFHSKENKAFHERLSLQMCKKLVPIVSKIIENANNRGEIEITDIDSYANFCVYGQLGILNIDTLSNKEKNLKIKNFLLQLFNFNN